MINWDVDKDGEFPQWPRVAVNGKLIAHEISCSVVGSGITIIRGLLTDQGINVKTHQRFIDVLAQKVMGTPLKMRFVDEGGVFGDEHNVDIFDVDVREIDGVKMYTLELMAI